MTTSSNKISFLFLALAILLCPAVFAKKKPEGLSSFVGSYGGSVTLNFADRSVSGPASANARGPKNGASVTISFAGSVTAEGDTLNYGSSIRLSKDGTYTISDIGMGLVPGQKIPYGGNYQGRNGKFSITMAANGRTISLSGDVQDHGSNRKLKLVIKFSGDQTLTFTNDLTAKAPKR